MWGLYNLKHIVNKLSHRNAAELIFFYLWQMTSFCRFSILKLLVI